MATPACGAASADAGFAVNHRIAPPASPAAPTMNATVDTLPEETASFHRSTPC